jgi:hypothetical protein
MTKAKELTTKAWGGYMDICVFQQSKYGSRKGFHWIVEYPERPLQKKSSRFFILWSILTLIAAVFIASEFLKMHSS